MAFNNTVVARSAAAIWGLKLGFQTTQYVLAQANVTTGGLNAVINSAFNDSYAGTSDANVAAVVVANLGLTGDNATAGAAYIVSQLATAPAGTKGSVITAIVNTFTTDAAFATLAAPFNALVASAVAYSSTAGTQDAVLGSVPSAASFNLTTGLDSLTGTAGADTFNAFIFDNQNTLQSADSVNGGGGTDTLYADMGASQAFSVTPIASNVENIVIRGQSRAADSGDNNIPTNGDNINTEGVDRVNVDAQRIVGATRFESNNSRADVIIEDVRILQSQITKDITVAFVQSDPGNVDFGVYFDQYSLTANRTNSSVLTLQVLDTKAASQNLAPLLDSPYDGVNFNVDGVLFSLKSQAINDAQDYDALVAALQVEAAKDTRLNGIVIQKAGTFTVTDPTSGLPATGTSITLSATNKVFTTGSWIASAGVPANSGLYTNQFAGTSASTDLVTSTVILDDVGRGATGGDLLIGSLANGTTPGGTGTPEGVERMEITVERDSRVQTINSTNNALKEVTIKNGTTKGIVRVNGSLATGGEQLPGANTNHNSTFGFVDVRLIDASGMTGNTQFTASISTASFAKYMPLTDTSPNPADDNTSTTGKTTLQVADFVYTGGAGADTIVVQGDAAVLSSNSRIQVGREDFTLNVNGGAGNDTITVRLVDRGNDGLVGGLAEVWYLNQKGLGNVTINGGDGNDTIRKFGAGDTRILTGAGNDTIYADNTGAQAVAVTVITNTNSNGPTTGQRAIWTFNTDNSTVPLTTSARLLRDVKSDANDAYDENIGTGNPQGLYKAEVTVNFKGLVAKVSLPSGVYFPTDLHINQAIKAAISGDPVLSKLIAAEDGPKYSLIVKSLIDGDMLVTDLVVSLKSVNVSTLTVSEQSTLALQYALPAVTPVALTLAQLQAALDGAVADWVTGADYTTAFGLADDGVTTVIGANSVTPSDNTITPGTNNDVIVLGTTTAAAAPESSNDTVVFSGVFGDDVIVNFQAGAAATGGDRLNLVGLGGTVFDTAPVAPAFLPQAVALDSANALPGAAFAAITSANNKQIHIRQFSTAFDTPTEVAAQFTDAGAVVTTAFSSVLILVDVDTVTPSATVNKGYVWSISDPTGAANVTATLVGTIDLADTDWFTLTSANFV